jgi:hypothetical protein
MEYHRPTERFCKLERPPLQRPKNSVALLGEAVEPDQMVVVVVVVVVGVDGGDV